MATKYCDHAAYSTSATFNMSQNAYSGAITVNSVQSGQIANGMILTHANFGQFTMVSEDTPGSYSVNDSRNYALSNISVTGVGGMPRTPPVWGVPIEGDGTASAPSPAAATVDIDLSGATAAAGNKFYISGAELACVASGAGNNQFNAGTGAALVTALVAAINRTGNTVVVNALATGWYQHKVQDVVFARVHPSVPTTLQIMARAGSTVHNSNANFQVTHTGITGLAGPFVFTGGVGGCWGVVINPAYWGGSNIAPYNYGVWGSVLPLAGSRTAGDVVKLRSHSRIKGNSVHLSLNASIVVAPAEGTLTNALVFEADDGTVWPADGTTPVFKIYGVFNNQYNQFRLATGNNYTALTHYKGKRYANGQRNFVLEAAAPGVSGAAMQLFCGVPSIYEQIDLICRDSGTVQLCWGATGPSNTRTTVRGVRVAHQKQKTDGLVSLGTPNEARCSTDITDLTLELFAADAPHVNVITPWTYGNNAAMACHIDGLTCIGFIAGSRLFSPYQANNLSNSISIRNAKLNEVSVLGPNMNAMGHMGTAVQSGLNGVFINGTYDKGVMVHETTQGMVVWSHRQEPPCMSARLKDGSAWSLRIIPPVVADVISSVDPLRVPLLGKVALEAGVKDVTVNLLLEKSMAWNTNHVSVSISYQDVSGNVCHAQSHQSANADALAVANNVWTKPTGESLIATDPADGVQRVSYNDGGTPLFFNQRSITLRTPTAVKADTVITVMVRVHRTIANSLQQLFVDPDPILVAVP